MTTAEWVFLGLVLYVLLVMMLTGTCRAAKLYDDRTDELELARRVKKAPPA